jgi:hypothetical protein
MMVFNAALEAQKKGEKFEAIGMPDARFGTIHQDDLADLFVKVAERVSYTHYFRSRLTSRHQSAGETPLSVIISSLSGLPISSTPSSVSLARKGTP